MFEQMLGSFLGSEQGRGAMQALQSKGIPEGQIQQIFSTALPAAASGLEEQGKSGGQSKASPLGTFDALGGHAGSSFLIAAATAMMRGEGVGGAVRDGAIGVVGGRIGEMLASRLGMSPQVASGIAAAITPFIVSFVQERLQGHPDVVAQRGNTPEGQEKFRANLAAKGLDPNGARAGGKPSAPQYGGNPGGGKPSGMDTQRGDAAWPSAPQSGESPYGGKPSAPQYGGGGFGKDVGNPGDHLTGGYAQKPMPSDGGGEMYPQKPGVPGKGGYGKNGFPQK